MKEYILFALILLSLFGLYLWSSYCYKAGAVLKELKEKNENG